MNYISPNKTVPIHYLEATTLAGLVRTKQLSSREVVQAHLDRTEAVNPKINAVVTLMGEAALEAADPAWLQTVRGEHSR
jgi:aspartyl-tRNA(Asn)/glutamyl-tRNA(Gln) amidotransferase subunit A